MLGISVVCQAQTLSIRPYVNYHQSVSAQTEPRFSPFNHLESAFRVGNENFTLSSGFEFGIAADYRFHSDWGVELGVGYFSSITNSYDLLLIIRGETTHHWDYGSIVVRPLFSHVVTRGKSTFIGKVGPVAHYSFAKITQPLSVLGERPNNPNILRFTNKWSLGYSLGLEYNYQLSERLHLAVNLGYEQYRYTPNRATISGSSGVWAEIRYVNEIVGEPHPPLPHKVMLKDAVLFNNVHFGIGVKYNLWKR